MTFSIDIPHIDRLLAALNDEPEIAAPIIRDATEQALLSLIPGLANYPLPPPNSTYRRGGTLGRLWAAARPEWQALPSGFEGSIDNATPYGPYVQGYDMQAKQHAGRWSTDQQIVEQHALETDQLYERAMQEIADAIDAKAQ